MSYIWRLFFTLKGVTGWKKTATPSSAAEVCGNGCKCRNGTKPESGINTDLNESINTNYDTAWGFLWHNTIYHTLDILIQRFYCHSDNFHLASA